MTTLHGEYKVIGGKLVAADLSLADGRIATASINGDFFLEPDEALEDLNAAVAGLSTDAEHRVIREAVERGLRPEAELFGVDAFAVASAVRRALGKATTWEDHEWEVIGPEPMPIALTLALDPWPWTRCSPDRWPRDVASRPCACGSGTSRPW